MGKDMEAPKPDSMSRTEYELVRTCQRDSDELLGLRIIHRACGVGGSDRVVGAGSRCGVRVPKGCEPPVVQRVLPRRFRRAPSRKRIELQRPQRSNLLTCRRLTLLS